MVLQGGDLSFTTRLPFRASAAVETLEKTTNTELIDKSVNTIRFLEIDAVCGEGEFGSPESAHGCTPMGHLLYDEVMRYNPKKYRPVRALRRWRVYATHFFTWPDTTPSVRGLEEFSSMESNTPGHPENFETPGIEVTTG